MLGPFRRGEDGAEPCLNRSKQERSGKRTSTSTTPEPRHGGARRSGTPERMAEAVVSALGVRLSTRERGVLSRILLGFRTEGVSLDLGI